MKKHGVTLLVMSVFSIVQVNQEVALCMCKHLQDLGKIQNVPESVFTDDIHLRQILLNIIANAVKFTESGHVAVILSKKQKRLIIEVEDTGIGIPEEDLDSIFDPFKQVHQHAHGLSEGTGLGTSIAQRFVTLLDGDIRVCSKLGKGSIFCIDMPCEFQGKDVCYEKSM
ncbi:MAG: ATP-binding protein [Mariprofundaceae bacterium]|nr:ATP-binding protein [Mariprofundaceae bacterium]